ncbi:M20 family peptidase [Brevibacillus fluminis]|uniref:Peptidase M20 domain-containing protein 2 n=1 Tax=Brevibacillus fluminis TaxID=511487 RepID=A0A3M8DID6_9BACL|nr:M20 family metallopeptidase [Brevibacillus fluminis]RNB87863.1 M20 family peptidase [Brevibacillus fluminis]
MNSQQMREMKQRILEAVDAHDETLRSIALTIHANPEIAFQEVKAVQWLTAPLKEAGFRVETGVADLPTAFRAEWEGQPGGPTIALLAEYDALPGLGHACGHNIIGTSAVGAALALQQACPELKGRIVVLGTPAEEDGGGKIIMCEKGLFDDVDAAMLCHPHKKTMVLRGALACVDATLQFFGKEAHASSAPETGISALDAMINAFVAINGLRQFFKEDVRIHGIITKGGEAPNIIPEYCEAKFILRAATVAELTVVQEKVYTAVKHAAAAVGARAEIQEGLVYAERNNNHALAGLFARNLEALGLEVSEPPKKGGIGSSDIGNVGQLTSTIHPYIQITEAGTHTPAFTEATASEQGMVGLIQAAKALAMTAYDLCADANALKDVREEFIRWKQNRDKEV